MAAPSDETAAGSCPLTVLPLSNGVESQPFRASLSRITYGADCCVTGLEASCASVSKGWTLGEGACLSGDAVVAGPASRPTGYLAQHTCHKEPPSDLTCVRRRNILRNLVWVPMGELGELATT